MPLKILLFSLIISYKKIIFDKKITYRKPVILINDKVNVILR